MNSGHLMKQSDLHIYSRSIIIINNMQSRKTWCLRDRLRFGANEKF